MNSLDTNFEGKRLSFYQLFTNNNYTIEIPIIQRDYAQGRESKFEVRELFLQALFDYLEEDKPNRDLDFVYGSTELDNNFEKFIPLDGQQRLTTLFLLHWYLAISSDNFEQFKAVMSFNNKSKFTYLTRTSSAEFCDSLLNNKVDFSRMLMADKNKKNSLSKTIKDCGWFFLSWNNDPTIQSMLVMLDAIHYKFNGHPHFYEKLIDAKHPIVTFLYLDLKEFNLTEDLYIKMNSRGKTLTKFENFKAKFEQYIETFNWDNERTFTLNFTDHSKDVSAKEYFSFKIDTDWANLFWQYRTLKGDPNTYDDELMSFIRTIIMLQFSVEPSSNIDSLNYLIGTNIARKTEGYSDDITFYNYKSLQSLSKNVVAFLVDAFDAFYNGNSKIVKHFDNCFYFDEDKNFKNVLEFSLKLPQIVQIYAYIKYLIINKNDKTGLFQWMRVVHNLTENTNIDSAEDVSSANKSIEKILPYCNNIIDFLISNNKIDFFYGRQVQEEVIKAILIAKSDEWKNAIELLEQNPYFKGQICFALEFADILNYYEKNNNLNWSVDEDLRHFNLFLNYSAKSSNLFSIIGTETNKDFILERAVLSKGDYLIETTYDRYNFLSTNKNLRDYSWKRLLRLPPLNINQQQIEKDEWCIKRYFVKDVLDDPNFDINNIEKSLINICKDIPNDWRKYFIKNPELIKYCYQGFISFSSETDIMLLMHKQLNHRHREMFTYDMYMKFFYPYIENFLPFESMDHIEIKSTDDISGIKLWGWCYKKIYYQIEIYKDLDSNKYFIVFAKSNGEKKQLNINIEIRNVLEKNNFVWDNNLNIYSFALTSQTKVVDLVKKICAEFKNL